MNISRSTLPKFRGQDGGEGGGVHIVTCCVPRSVAEVIKHTEPTLTIETHEVDVDVQGDEHPSNATAVLTTDGRSDAEHRRSHWELDQLVTITGDDAGRVIKIRVLSSDRRTLTEDVYLGERVGKPVMTLVLERQTPP
jgi:hypothetical protein